MSRVNDPRLRLSPLARPATPSVVHMPIEFVLLAAVLSRLEVVGDRRSTWSLGKYDIEDCRRGFGALKLRADGGGVDRPNDEEVRGESTLGETGLFDRFVSSSCSGRGPTVGEETAGEVGVAGTTALMF